MTTKKKTSKPLKSFRTFGIEASVWPPKPEYNDDSPKISLSRSYRDKEGNFRSTSYFAPEELAVALKQGMKALCHTAPDLVDETMEHLLDIARHMGQEAAAADAAESVTA